MKRFCLLLFFMANLLPAQKRVTKSLLNPEITAITLDATNSFELSVNTARGNEMLLEASFDGEYSNDLLINVRESGKTLMVSTGFQPNFKNPNDKLSAHKVISIALKVVLPERKRVTIYGTGCKVTAKGKYDTLKITLSDGLTFLKNVQGIVEVASQSGTISVAAASGSINASTKYGRVGPNEIPFGDVIYNLSSVTGDILLDKIE